MDPNANLQEQLELARKITETIDSTTEAPDNYSVSDWARYDEAKADRNEDIAEWANRLAELVTALDEWRRSGGFDPYKPAEPEPTRERPPGTIRVQFECLTEATLRETWEADIPADTPEDELEDAIWEAQATVGEGAWEFVDEKNLGEGDRDLVKESIEIIGGDHE